MLLCSNLRNAPFTTIVCFFQGRGFKGMCLGHCMSPVWQIEIKLGFNIL